MRSRIRKVEKELLGGRAPTIKRYRKTNGAKRLSAASCVGGVVTTQERIVSPEVEFMRNASSRTMSGMFLAGRFISVWARNILRSVVRSG